MLAASKAALPADIAIFAAAVADWRVAEAGHAEDQERRGRHAARWRSWKTRTSCRRWRTQKSKRPKLVIGFAAETENVIANAQAKLARRACDWILANDVSAESGVMGGDRNAMHLVTANGVEDWPEQSKDEVARMLIDRIAERSHDTSDVRIARLPHGARPAAAGLSERTGRRARPLRRRAGRCAGDARARRLRVGADRDRHGIAARDRRAGAAALRARREAMA